MKKTFIASFLLATCTLAHAFNEVIVTDEDPNGWQAANVRDDALVEISLNQPLLGDGSLLFATDTVTNGQDKADYQLFWQQSADGIDFPDRTLGNVTDLNYAWFRDSSSTTIAHLTPVFRLNFYDDNGTPADLGDDVLGILVWEGVYNGYNNPIEDSWELVNIRNDNFWVFVSVNGQGTGIGVIQNFNVTLDDWINGTPSGQPGDPQINLSADTYIIGVNVGVGSGWGNTFLGYVDAVRVAFGANDDFLYNFEVCPVQVPNTDPDVIFNNSFECFQ